MSIEYSVAVCPVSDKKLYLCRRIDTTTYKGKWQPVWRELGLGELPMPGACNMMMEKMGIKITENRLHWVETLTDKDMTKMCWVYLIHLNTDEVPHAPPEKEFSDWVLQRLDKAAILDLVPGFRVIPVKLLKTLKKSTTVIA